jgi:hypothetical protein
VPEIVNTLAELGATRSTLTPAQSDQLDQFGYLPLPGILDEVTLEALRVRCDELSASEADRAGIEAHQEQGTARLANLVDKDRMFDRCWNHPAQLARVISACTQTGRVRSHRAPIRCATPSGCLTRLPKPTGPPGWCPVRTAGDGSPGT